MANTLTKINVHITFHIKKSCPPIKHEDIPRLHAYMSGIVRSLGCAYVTIGGVNDHVHLLLPLPKTMAVSELVRTIKTRSSVWIKEQSPYYTTFAWQEGYGAFSVSPSLEKKTEEYIQRQEEHHKIYSFREEYIKILKGYNIDYDERYTFDE